MSRSARVVIVSPAMAQANNGNWQTAFRWRRLLSVRHRVRITGVWPDAESVNARGRDADEVMLALHARRMAPAVSAWYDRRGSKGLGVVLTGTDLYRDIHTDPMARQSLDQAARLVVLQDHGLTELSEAWRSKARVIVQSTTPRNPVEKTDRHFTAVMVGHLRPEKAPEVWWAAARRIPAHVGIRLVHIGDALDASMATQARATEAECPHYRWLGGLDHESTRRRIQRAHVLVHPSRMEGGAHVVMEAVCSGTPVLASRISGNLGMLGADYGGYFAVDDADAVAGALMRLRQEQRQNPPRSWLEVLAAQCQTRRSLFEPRSEQAALLSLVNALMDT